MTSLAQYDRARSALAEATRVDQVLPILDEIEHVKLYARQIKDRALLAEATEFQMKAERRLGVIIIEAKKAGHFVQGRRDLEPGARENEKTTDEVVFPRATLIEAGVDHKLSAKAQKVAGLSDDQFQAAVDAKRAQIAAGKAITIEVGPPDAGRSIMASRAEPDDSLDYFPTPPWATRALLHYVLPQLGIDGDDHGALGKVWEPACGEGHISEVLRGCGATVYATDIFDYGTDCQDRVCDFLSGDYAPSVKPGRFDWIITNPPFGDKTIAFVQRALKYGRIGVAMFFRSQWAVEGIERYEVIFRDRPPTLCAFFVERVNLCKGRWNPDGTTATAYCWLVWLTDDPQPRAPFWIPPGCRASLSLATDRERFAAPVSRPQPELQSGSVAPTEAATNITENIPAPEPTELEALEAIDNERALPDVVLAKLKEQKLVRGSAKPKLTKAGIARLDKLRAEAIPDEAIDAPYGATPIFEKRQDVKVDCRVCSDGNGLCVECLSADSHIVTHTNPNGEAVATCSCGWKHVSPWGDHHEIQERAIKEHWQTVVDVARQSESGSDGSVTDERLPQESPPPESSNDDGLGIPTFLQRVPAEAAE